MNDTLAGILPLVLIVLLFYLLLIRPQQKRRRQLAQLQSQLHRGQRVMTNSMLIANVAAVDGDEVLLEVAPEVECRYSKSAIVQVLGPSEGAGGESQPSSGQGGTEDTPRS